MLIKRRTNDRADASSTSAPAPVREARGFSSAKREIVLYLKRTPDASLAEIARASDVSKAAALGHLRELETERWIERSYRRGSVGRPAVGFRLAEGSDGLFPQGYGEMSRCALAFIERRLGRPAVVELLQEREVADLNRARLASGDLRARVSELARIRTEGGYMAELGARRRDAIEMREHNCPILTVAQEYPEACDAERRMFESLLHARIEVSHRVAAGDPVCRFWIRDASADR